LVIQTQQTYRNYNLNWVRHIGYTTVVQWYTLMIDWFCFMVYGYVHKTGIAYKSTSTYFQCGPFLLDVLFLLPTTQGPQYSSTYIKINSRVVTARVYYILRGSVTSPFVINIVETASFMVLWSEKLIPHSLKEFWQNRTCDTWWLGQIHPIPLSATCLTVKPWSRRELA